jgi:hypothetical protein
MVRAGIKPPNHAKKNVNAVKEQSKLNALRKLQVIRRRYNSSECHELHRDVVSPIRPCNDS